MLVDEFDPHALAEQDFLDEVHSFQFWFDSIEGYLSDRPYGRLETTVDEHLDDTRRERLITTLCNYSVGETAALEGAAGLVQLAPDRNSKIFMATQVVDEARHLEVFLHRLRELGVVDPEAEIERRAQPALVDFKGALLELIAQGDWQAGVFAAERHPRDHGVHGVPAPRGERRRGDEGRAGRCDLRRAASRRLRRERPRAQPGAATPRDVAVSARSAPTSTPWSSASSRRRWPTSARRPVASPQLAGEYLDTIERLGLT